MSTFTRVKLDDAGTSTFRPSRIDDAGITITALPGQTEDLFRVLDKDGTEVAAIGPTGVFTSTGGASPSGPLTVTSTSASALVVGRQGATDPVLKINANTASVATGIAVTGAAAASGVAVAAISSGTDEPLTIDAKGAGIVTIAGVSTGGIKVGVNATDRVAMKGFYMNPAVIAVAVPTIANDAAENSDSVDVDVSAAFAIQPAVGDAVIAIPMEALPTDCLLCGAYVSATDHIIVSFTSKEGGGGVTGANKNFNFLVVDLT